MVAAGLTCCPSLCTEKLVAQLVDIVVTCSAASALVAPAASIHCAGELLKLLKELSTHSLSSQDWPSCLNA